jgi:hypothetical protein
VILLSETPPWPAYNRYFNLLEGLNDIISYATSVGNGAIFTYPDSIVDTTTKMFCEMPINEPTDLMFTFICMNPSFY